MAERIIIEQIELLKRHLQAETLDLAFVETHARFLADAALFLRETEEAIERLSAQAQRI